MRFGVVIFIIMIPKIHAFINPKLGMVRFINVNPHGAWHSGKILTHGSANTGALRMCGFLKSEQTQPVYLLWINHVATNNGDHMGSHIPFEISNNKQKRKQKTSLFAEFGYSNPSPRRGILNNANAPVLGKTRNPDTDGRRQRLHLLAWGSCLCENHVKKSSGNINISYFKLKHNI